MRDVEQQTEGDGPIHSAMEITGEPARDAMLSFIRIGRLISYHEAHRNTPEGICVACRCDQAVPYSDGPRSGAPACTGCLQEYKEVRQTARSVTAASTLRPSPRTVIMRVALLRALPAMSITQLPGVSYLIIIGCCAWCRQVVHSARSYTVLRKRFSVTCRRTVFGPRHLHGKCWKKIEEVICAERIALCMTSCALWLPLLPEVCRQVALFVAQLSAAGVEAAAATSPMILRPT